MTTITDDLRRLAEAATPGPWWDAHRSAHGVRRIFRDRDLIADVPIEADAAYLAACSPHAILALLDERDRLREALEALVYHGPSEDGNPNGQMWCSDCQSSLGEPHRETCLWEQARIALAKEDPR